MLARRGHDLDVKVIEKLEANRKKLQIETEKLQSDRNKWSKEIGKRQKERKGCPAIAGQGRVIR